MQILCTLSTLFNLWLHNLVQRLSSPFELHTRLILVSTKYYKNKQCILYTPKEIAVDLLRLSKGNVLFLEMWCPSCHREQCASEIAGCLVLPSSYSHFLLHMLTVIAALGAELGTMGQKCLFTTNNHCQGRKNCFEIRILSLTQAKSETQTVFGLWIYSFKRVRFTHTCSDLKEG